MIAETIEDGTGLSVAEMPPPEEPTDRPMPIAFDLACIGCGYNLRTLEVSAACPECGRAVHETLAAFGEAWSEDAVKRWRGACKWIGISGLLTAAVPIGMLGGSLISAAGLGAVGPVIMLGLIAGLVLAEHSLWLRGVLRLTGDHPGRQQVSPFALLRLRGVALINGGIALLAVLIPIVLGVIEIVSMEYRNFDDLWLLWGILVACGVTARAVTVGCLMQLMTRTLGAAGHLWKRRHLVATGTAVILLCAAQGLATSATLISTHLDDSFFGFAVGVGMGSLVALPIIAIWAAVSVFRAGVAFKLPTS